MSWQIQGWQEDPMRIFEFNHTPSQSLSSDSIIQLQRDCSIQPDSSSNPWYHQVAKLSLLPPNIALLSYLIQFNPWCQTSQYVNLVCYKSYKLQVKDACTSYQRNKIHSWNFEAEIWIKNTFINIEETSIYKFVYRTHNYTKPSFI